MRLIRLIVFVGCLWSTALWAQLPKADSSMLKRHVAALTADPMQGRATGDTGYQLAAQYVANNLLELGLFPLQQELLPANTAQDFMLPVPMRKEALMQVTLQAGRKSWSLGRALYTNRAVPQEKLMDTSWVLAGNGDITALPSGSLVNKTVVVFHQPGENQPTEREILWKLHRANPKAIIWIDAAYKKQYKKSIENLKKTRIRIDYEQANNNGVQINTRITAPVIYLSEKTAKKLWKANNLDWKESLARLKKPVSRLYEQKAAYTLSSKWQTEAIQVPNVAAMMPGTEKTDSYVLLTGHLDHLGVHDKKVHPGADDNGSGSAALLEMAAMMVKLRDQGQLPKRNIAFVWFTGEEMGLLGSQYFTQNPPVPMDQLMANLNVDMIGRRDEQHGDDPNYIYLIGSDRLSTELHNLSEEANDQCCQIKLDYRFNAANDPNRYYQRSDHYNFARQGIPVIFYFSGVHADYHKTGDTADKLEYDRMARITDLIFNTAIELAQREAPLNIDKP